MGQERGVDFEWYLAREKERRKVLRSKERKAKAWKWERKPEKKGERLP